MPKTLRESADLFFNERAAYGSGGALAGGGRGGPFPLQPAI